MHLMHMYKGVVHTILHVLSSFSCIGVLRFAFSFHLSGARSF